MENNIYVFKLTENQNGHHSFPNKERYKKLLRLLLLLYHFNRNVLY